MPHFSPFLREVGILLCTKCRRAVQSRGPMSSKRLRAKENGPKSEAVSGGLHPVKVTIIIAYTCANETLKEPELDGQPISITKTRLTIPISEFRSKLKAHITDGETASGSPISDWDSLRAFNAQAEVWRDFGHELLLSAFDSIDVADGLLMATRSSRTSGNFAEWLSDGRQALGRGISYLRSIEKRLELVRDPHAATQVARVARAPLDRQSLIEKIQNLKAVMIEGVTGGPRDESEYRALREQIWSEQDLLPLLPSLFRECVDLGSVWDYLKRFKHYAERRSFIRTEFQRVISFLEESQDSHTVPQRFFAAGTEHDAFVEIRSIIKTAQKEIWIVDSWVDESIWALLKNLKPGVKVKILTSNAKGDFSLERTKFCKQHGAAIEVRAVRSYHDRFILADGTRCWHLGASIKDAGSKACLISEIQSGALISSVVADVQQTWATATPLP